MTGHWFWLSLTGGYMGMVGFLSFYLSRDPVGNRLLSLPLILGKFLSGGLCLLFLLVHHRYFIYLLNGIVDLSLSFFFHYLYRQTDPVLRLDPGDFYPPLPEKTLKSALEAMAPDLSEKIRDLTFQEIQGWIRGSPSWVQTLFPYLLFFLEWNPPLFHLTFRRFSSLPVKKRIEVLEKMEGSRLFFRHQVAVFLKLILSLFLYSQEEVRVQTGYRREYVEEKIRIAHLRRERGEKGPYPLVEEPPQ